jgi:hypothetical protein
MEAGASVAGIISATIDRPGALRGRGIWSAASEQLFIDISDSWQASDKRGLTPSLVDIPFYCDGEYRALRLTRTFQIPVDAECYAWRLALDGVEGRFAVRLNGNPIDERFSGGMSYQLAVDPRVLKFKPGRNELELTLDNRMRNSGAGSLTGGLYARRRYGGIYGGTYLIGVAPITENPIEEQDSSVQATVFGHDFHLSANGWTLDGRPTRLRGVSYMTSHPLDGALPNYKRWEKELAQVRDMGAQVVRFVQGPAPLELLDLCDRQGILVFEELPIFQAPERVLSDPDFISAAAGQLEAMIVRDRRFGCITGWGLGSELPLPTRRSESFYRRLTELAHSLDDRPVYATFPMTTELHAAPLDFAILEITPYSRYANAPLPLIMVSDRTVLVGGIRQAIVPNLAGDPQSPNSESAQAVYIDSRIREAVSLSWCAGVVVGDLTDWRGEKPSLSGPLRGASDIYTTGLIDDAQKPRIAFNRIKSFWRGEAATTQPGTAYPASNTGLFVGVGLCLMAILFWSTRQNNLFRLNFYRSLASPRNFFQDIRNQRYLLSGHTVLMAMVLSGSVALVWSGWLFAHRQSYPLDWVVNHLFGSARMVGWIASLLWDPLRGLLFFWVLVFVAMWLTTLQLIAVAGVMRRRISVTQSLNFVVWSSVYLLALLPLGLFADRLFAFGWGWLPITMFIMVTVISLVRFIGTVQRLVRRPIGGVLIVWSALPVTVLVAAVLILGWTQSLYPYWSYFWGTILQ